MKTYGRSFILNPLCLYLLTLSLCPQVAFAHAELVSSNPAAGSILTSVPQTMTLTFNEPIGEESRVALTDAQFRRTELLSRITDIDGIDGVDEINADVLIVEMPDDVADGVYSIEFDAVSADGHTVLGSIQFQIADESNRAWIVWGGIAVIVSLAAVFMRRKS